MIVDEDSQSQATSPAQSHPNLQMEEQQELSELTDRVPHIAAMTQSYYSQSEYSESGSEEAAMEVEPVNVESAENANIAAQ